MFWKAFIGVVLLINAVKSVPFLKNDARKENVSHRLPKNVETESYIVDLTVTDKAFDVNNKDPTFEGKVEVKFKLTAIVEKLLINCDENIVIKSIKLKDEVINEDSYKILHGYQQLGIVKYLKSETTSLVIEYTGKIYDDMYGFYRSYYYENEDKKVMLSTQFEPTYARRAFPCFDEPQFKAKFKIKITHPKKYTALSNNIKSTEKDEGENKITTFSDSPKMSTYLVAFVVSDFEKKIVSDVRNKIMNIWTRKKDYGLDYSADVTTKILDALNTYTKSPYFNLYVKQLDQVAVPDFGAGAMENWGLVTYRESRLLWDPTESSRRNKQGVATVIAHEFAHQWFGNLVTLDWWSSTWLNEGFARFFEYYITLKIEPNWQLEKQFVIEQLQAVMVSDGFINTVPMTSKEETVLTPGQISAKFSQISYAKGAAILRMIEYIIGKDNFETALQKYLSTKKNKNAVPEDLFKAFEDTIKSKVVDLPKDRTITQISGLWTTQAGYPVVNAIIKDKTIELSQEHFLYDGNGTKIKWDIPISYTSFEDKDFDVSNAPRIWLTAADTNIAIGDIKDGWYIVNIGQTGYYRVNYDKELWNRLAKGLKSDNSDGIDVMNRAQIVDDVLNLARADKVDYSLALDVTSYLEKETDYYPWYSAFNSFAFLRKRLPKPVSVERDIRNALEEHIKKLLNMACEENKDFTIEVGDTQIQVFMKEMVLKWACDLNMGDCAKNAQVLFDKFAGDPENAQNKIDPNLRSVVYCNALRYADNDNLGKRWDTLWNRFKTSSLASEQTVILGALGCTTNEDKLLEYLKKSITADSIRKQDGITVFTSVINGSPKGVDVAFNFFKENHKEIVEHYASLNSLASVIKLIGDSITTRQQVHDFRSYIRRNAEDLKDIKSAAEEALENAKATLKWFEDRSEELADYFHLPKITTTAEVTTSTTTEDPNSSQHLFATFNLILSTYALTFAF